MAWEPEDPDQWKQHCLIEWWQVVLDSVWAADSEIARTCGPEYLMWLDAQWREEAHDHST
jgi:hypothetical protein